MLVGFISCLFTVTVAVLVPVGSFIYFAVRRNRCVRPYIAGVLTFLIFQVLTRIPVIQTVLPGFVWYQIMPYTNPLLYAVLLGLSAAVFEEGGRYIVMRLFLKNNLRYADGVAFGLGHGGLEALLFAGIGALWMLVSYGAPIGVSSEMMMIGGAERMFAIILHVGWSVMVLESVRSKKPLLLAAAVLTHAAADVAVVYMQQEGFSILIIEGVIALFAVGMLVYILAVKKRRRVVQ